MEQEIINETYKDLIVEFSNNASSQEITKFVSSHHAFSFSMGALIGQGSFGTVYMGLNKDNGQLMAVK